MAKLYWRIKVDGRWTWTPANVIAVNGEAEGGPEYLVKEDPE